MRISNEMLTRLYTFLTERLREGGGSVGAIPPTPQAPANRESLHLSLEMQLVVMLHQLVRQMPEVDSTKVAAIAEQIRSGAYQPDARSVAEALLGEGKGTEP